MPGLPRGQDTQLTALCLLNQSLRGPLVIKAVGAQGGFCRPVRQKGVQADKVRLCPTALASSLMRVLEVPSFHLGPHAPCPTPHFHLPPLLSYACPQFQLPGTVKGLSGFFKVLLWRRAMQLRPWETEGLKEGRQRDKKVGRSQACSGPRCVVKRVG